VSTSGSVDYSQNRDQIITRALNVLDVVGVGFTASATQISHAANVLNMLIKSWQGQTDFARGLKVWARKRGYLFLQTGQHEYTLPGDHWTNSYVTTTTTAAALSGAGTIDIASATGMTDGDYLGVELSTGALQWTTISGAPSTTLTLAASLIANVASGARVFAYTTRATRPLSLIAAVRRDVNGTDTPMEMLRTATTYEAITLKSATGTPSLVFYEPSLPAGWLSLDTEPTDVTDVLRLTYVRPLEDVDASTDDLDYPQEWFRPLSMGLAREIAPDYGVQWDQQKEMIYKEALAIAQQANPEVSDAYFEPGRD
jgi:hypothetical protein